MAFVGVCANYHHDSGNTNTSGNQTYLIDVAVGDTIIMYVDTPVTGTVTSWTFTDSKGNTYTVNPTDAVQTAPSNYQLQVAICKVTNAIVGGVDTYNVTVAGANPAKWCILAAVFDDLIARDTMANNHGSGSTISATTAAAGSQNQELIIMGGAYTDIQNTPVGFSAPDAGFSALGPVTAAPTTTTPRSLGIVYGYVNAAGTRTANASLSTGEGWAALLLAMTQQVAAPPPPKTGINIVTADGVMQAQMAIVR